MSTYEPEAPPLVEGEDARAITEWLQREHEALAAAINQSQDLDRVIRPTGYQEDGQLRFFDGSDVTYPVGLWITTGGVWTQIV